MINKDKIQKLITEMKELYSHAKAEFEKLLIGIGDSKLLQDTLNHFKKCVEKLKSLVRKADDKVKERLSAMHTHLQNAKYHLKHSEWHKSYKDFLEFGSFLGTVEAIIFAFILAGVA